MKNKKKLAFILSITLLLVAASFITYFYSIKSIEFKNINLLNKHGWENVKFKAEDNSVRVDINNELDKMKLRVSEQIGLKPNKYLDKSLNFKIYIYDLCRIGNTQGLYATIWTYKNSIVCAYIYHTEPKIKIKYWSLDTTYSEIVKDIENEISKLK